MAATKAKVEKKSQAEQNRENAVGWKVALIGLQLQYHSQAMGYSIIGQHGFIPVHAMRLLTDHRFALYVGRIDGKDTYRIVESEELDQHERDVKAKEQANENAWLNHWEAELSLAFTLEERKAVVRRIIQWGAEFELTEEFKIPD